MGEPGVTDGRYGNEAFSNSKERQATVDAWHAAPIEQDGLRTPNLCDVKYDQGYKCVLVRQCGTKELMNLIKDMLVQTLKDGFDAKKIVVQIIWQFDDFATWTKEESDNLKGAIRYISRELRRQVFAVQLIGPGTAASSLTPDQMKEKGGLWNETAEELNNLWAAEGLCRWNGEQLEELLPCDPSNPRRKTGGSETDNAIQEKITLSGKLVVMGAVIASAIVTT